MEGSRVNTFLSTGDLGDAIAMLPCVRSAGKSNIVFCPQTKPMQGRESMKGGRFEAIRPLLEAQPYIGKVEWKENPAKASHDMRDFRQAWAPGENLIELQARYIGLEVSDAPWLQCMRSPASLGRPVFARSPRYHNPQFPWHVCMTKYRNALFVGAKGEHEAFEAAFGRVEFCPTGDLLALAEVIAGCSIFVGNQSCPFWIAAGLGVPLIQECWPHDPNSQVRRPNARYLMRGPFIL